MSDEYKRGYEDGYRDANQSYEDGYRDASEVWRNKTLVMERQLEIMVKHMSEVDVLRPMIVVLPKDETKPA